MVANWSDGQPTRRCRSGDSCGARRYDGESVFESQKLTLVDVVGDRCDRYGHGQPDQVIQHPIDRARQRKLISPGLHTAALQLLVDREMKDVQAVGDAAKPR